MNEKKDVKNVNEDAQEVEKDEVSEDDQVVEKENDELSPSDVIQLLWEDAKYRHDVYWQSIYRYGLAIGALTIAPYMLNLVTSLGIAVIIFPAVGIIITLFSVFHLFSDAHMWIISSLRYYEMMERCASTLWTIEESKSQGCLMDLFTNIGYSASPLVFFLLASGLQIANFYVLISLLK